MRTRDGLSISVTISRKVLEAAIPSAFEKSDSFVHSATSLFSHQLHWKYRLVAYTLVRRNMDIR